MKKIIYLILGFIFIVTCATFSSNFLDKEKDKIKQELTDKKESLESENYVLNQNKNTPQFKYAIFDICQSFWKKSLYELLYAYQKKQGNVPWSYYFKMIKYGTAYALGNLNPKKAYEDFLGYLKGNKLSDIKKQCARVWQDECKKFILIDAKNNFDKCKKDGIITIIADSGISQLYDDLLKEYSFDYICSSELEFKDGVITGKLLGEPCSGKDKLNKVRNLIENKLGGSLRDAIFYANSHNDIPLLQKVGKPVIVNPTSKLKSYAKSKKWNILTYNKVVD